MQFSRRSHCHIKEKPCYTQVQNPARFASFTILERNNLPRWCTHLRRYKGRHNFASFKTKTPKGGQGNDTLWRWNSYPFCVPPKWNPWARTRRNTCPWGTISQNLGYQSNTKRLFWRPWDSSL
jgi:hypothetical protein